MTEDQITLVPHSVEDGVIHSVEAGMEVQAVRGDAHFSCHLHGCARAHHAVHKGLRVELVDKVTNYVARAVTAPF